MASCAEWVRCNKCFAHFGNNESKFHLTQCGHIYCGKCITQAEKQCFQCNTVGTVSLPLNNPLSPQIAHYFADVHEQVEKISQTVLFQESQRAICMQMGDEMSKKYQSIKEAYWANSENLKKTMNKYQKLKIAYMSMIQKEKQHFTSTDNFVPHHHFTTPMQQKSSTGTHYGGNYFQGSRVPETPITIKNDGVFRVPSSRFVPRSASTGYHTASSRSSNTSTLNSRR